MRNERKNHSITHFGGNTIFIRIPIFRGGKFRFFQVVQHNQKTSNVFFKQSNGKILIVLPSSRVPFFSFFGWCKNFSNSARALLHHLTCHLYQFFRLTDFHLKLVLRNDFSDFRSHVRNRSFENRKIKVPSYIL